MTRPAKVKAVEPEAVEPGRGQDDRGNVRPADDRYIVGATVEPEDA